MEKLCQKPWNIYHLEMIFPVKHTKTIIYYIYRRLVPKKLDGLVQNSGTSGQKCGYQVQPTGPRTEAFFFCQPKRWVGSASCCESPKFGTQKSTVQRLSSSDYVSFWWAWQISWHMVSTCFYSMAEMFPVKLRCWKQAMVNPVFLRMVCLFLSAGWTFAQPEMARISSYPMAASCWSIWVWKCWETRWTHWYPTAESWLMHRFPMYVPHEIAI